MRDISARELKGHNILAVERFQDNTRWMIEFSIATLDAARNSGLISYVQYVQNGCVYFTDAGLQEYIAKCTHRAKPVEKSATYRKLRSVRA